MIVFLFLLYKIVVLFFHKILGNSVLQGILMLYLLVVYCANVFMCVEVNLLDLLVHFPVFMSLLNWGDHTIDLHHISANYNQNDDNVVCLQDLLLFLIGIKGKKQESKRKYGKNDNVDFTHYSFSHEPKSTLWHVSDDEQVDGHGYQQYQLHPEHMCCFEMVNVWQCTYNYN